MLTEFVETKWNRRAFNSLLKTIRETKAPIEGTGVAQTEAWVYTEENVTTDHC